MIVLCILVLITGMVIAFFSSVSTEYVTSKSSFARATGKELADATVQVAIGQIRQATTQPVAGSSLCWASQPGMIRAYGNPDGSASSAPYAYYKLYSSDNMVVTAGQLGNANYDPLANPNVDLAYKPANSSDWYSAPALFTDLNAPVVGSNGTSYPIIDATIIIDSTKSVTGFHTTSAPVASAASNPVPMPVKWIYQLRDGTLTAPIAADSTGTTASFANAAATKKPTVDNPIVGRIAFWTDDETCKVNINTASEGTYWDVPRANGTEESGFGSYQPAQHEWQRYPGHPAMTCLSTVFPALTPQQIYALTPRINGGGSNAGTITINSSTAITPDTDRLYASVDELIFNPLRTDANTAGLTKTQVEQARFFLTANSRAPEVNLFGKPRIACWPIHKDFATNLNSPYVTAFDKLIAFCSTIKGLPYYFQRQDRNSPTNDISIGRNLSLYPYLQKLTSQAEPGFGGNFLTKYADDRDQILTEIFDYIRSTNLQDDNLPAANRFTPPPGAGWGWVTPTWSGATMGFGRAYTLSGLAIGFICNADGMGFLINGVKPTLAQCGNNQTVKDANDAKIDSNRAVGANANPILGGTPLKGEPFLDVGYSIAGVPVAGTAGNNVFDWDDTNGNGRCDFEPWDDVNENGLYDAAESYVDVNSNGKYDQEWHEPLHDWGRDNNFTTLDLDGSQGPAGNAGKRQGNGIYDPGEKCIQSVVVPDFFSVMQGLVGMNGNVHVTVSGLSQLTITDINGVTSALYSPLLDTTTVDYISNPSSVLYGGECWGSAWGWRCFAAGATSRSPAAFHLTSNPIRITGASPTMSFSGGVITVKLSTYAGTQPLYQTFKINLPAAPLLPVPKITATGTTFAGQAPVTTPQQWWSFFDFPVSGVNTLGRLNNSVGTNPGPPSARKTGAVFREEYDVVRGVVLKHGDFRLLAAQQTVNDPTNLIFMALPNYQSLDATSCQLSNSCPNNANPDLLPNLGGAQDTNRKYFANPSLSLPATSSILPYIYPSASGANRPEATGDFDNGVGYAMDGAYVNKPDEGTSLGKPSTDFLGPNAPYFFQTYGWTAVGTAHFSPNRMMPSPGMFGSLPSGVVHGTPWRTLLFRPQGSDFASQPFLTQHPASLNSPPDHLLMDLFWMPVVEPYAISEPFSTGGKVNMNYQIMPFTYIERSTALRAVFKAEKLGVIPNTGYVSYKTNVGLKSIRQEIDVNSPVNVAKKDTEIETLNQFAKKFADGKLFKSASEICDVHIVPTGQTAAGMPGFWNTAQPTGDNLRERIYTTLYSRLTTKSNSYTVHFRVQVLKKVPGTDVAQWVEGKDRTVSEYRGSTLVERYIDPSDPSLPDFTDPANTDTLDNHYKFRVVNTKKFTAE
ncbi:MAG: Verru_Chthon cassette protein A [Phycisphaerae bacterium]